MYYMNRGSYKKEPDWQSRSDARLEKWLKQKKEEKRRSDLARMNLVLASVVYPTR